MPCALQNRPIDAPNNACASAANPDVPDQIGFLDSLTKLNISGAYWNSNLTASWQRAGVFPNMWVQRYCCCLCGCPTLHLIWPRPAALLRLQGDSGRQLQLRFARYWAVVAGPSGCCGGNKILQVSLIRAWFGDCPRCSAGSLPASWATSMTKLVGLYLGGGLLSGTIPATWAAPRWSALQVCFRSR